MLFGRGDLIPAIDVETTDNQSQATVVTALQTLVHGVQAAIGALPAIYASPSWWDDDANSSAFTADPLWLACWCSGGNPPGPAHNWGGFGWQAWQYTDAGSVPGVAGPVDLNQGNPGPPLYNGSTTTVINGPENAPLGQTVTFAATVNPPPAAGTITFADNGTPIGGCSAEPVTGSGATCHTSSLPPGHSVDRRTVQHWVDRLQ